MTAKKPAALRLIEGNPGRRPIPKEVKGKGRPRAPESFDEAHLKVWNELLEGFPTEFLTLADSLTIERTVRNIVLYRRCSDELVNESKLLLKDKSHQDRIIQNPYLKIRFKVEEVLGILTRELGLSPMARTRMDVPEDEQVDPLDRLLGMSINGNRRA